MPSRLSALSLALLTLVSMTSPVSAQRTLLAVSGGATIGDLSGDGVDTPSRWGGTAGVIVAHQGWDYVITQVEANWVQKGGEGLRLDYVEVPVMVGGLAQTSSGISARLTLGLGVAFPVGCSATGAPDVTCEIDRKVEWALPMGIQFGRRLDGNRFVAIDARYSWAVSDAFDEVRAANRSWQFRMILGVAR
jgi:hypothetical protein